MRQSCLEPNVQQIKYLPEKIRGISTSMKKEKEKEKEKQKQKQKQNRNGKRNNNTKQHMPENDRRRALDRESLV